MAPFTRRQVLAMLGAGGGLVAVGHAVRGIVGMAVSQRGASDAPGTAMMDRRLMSTGRRDGSRRVRRRRRRKCGGLRRGN